MIDEALDHEDWIAGEWQNARNGPSRDGEERFDGGASRIGARIGMVTDNHSSAERIAEDIDSTYLANYSINATDVKNNMNRQRLDHHSFKVGIPLSNNEMLLNQRDAVTSSPTVSRYSAAIPYPGVTTANHAFNNNLQHGVGQTHGGAHPHNTQTGYNSFFN